MMTDRQSRKILVIGGSRGIGAAVIRAFVSERADVTFTYAGSEAAAADLAIETGAVAIRSDAAARDDLLSLIRSMGSLDVFVFNAAMHVMGDPLDLDPSAIDRMIDVNIRSAYHGCVEAGREMAKGGRIIIVGSVNGDRVSGPGLTAYSMTKAAAQGIARGLARDFGSRDITVNVVQPGPTDTDMNPADGPRAADMHAVMALKRHGTASPSISLAGSPRALEAAGLGA